MTEESPTLWRLGYPWPSAWNRPPRFSNELGEKLRFAEVVNGSWLVENADYPVGSMIPLPDRYGKTDRGSWVLWEEKGRDNVGKALRQLDGGLRELLDLGRSVDILGLSLERFDGKEGWRCSRSGLLMRSGQLGDVPHSISGRTILVEQRGL